MRKIIYVSIWLIFGSCSSNISMVKDCVDCLNKFNDSSKYMDLLFSIGFDGRPTCINTDYNTLEKRLGVAFKKLSGNDSLLTKTNTEIFFICYKEKVEYYDNFFPTIIMDSIEHLTIINKDAVKLLQYISINPIDSLEADRILKKFGFEILKSREKIGAYWFSGDKNFIQFNCLAGYKRLVYCRDTLPKYKFEENHLFRLKQNWYLYDNPKGRYKRYERIIKRKQKKYKWT